MTELLLEIAFVPIALAWLWLPDGDTAGPTRRDLLPATLIAATLIVPLVQLVPLPPAIWTALPGRENEVAALSLVGEQSSWRPISMSPSRTLASLLAVVPPLFCFYAVSRLDLRERRLVLTVIVVMAVISACLGVVQLTAGGNGINFYSQHHVGWITGFQANRNAEADLLLIGCLALLALAAPYVTGERIEAPLALSRRAFGMLAAAVGLLLLAATVMTGSRAGISLILVVAVAALGIFGVSRDGARPFVLRPAFVVAIPLLLAGIAVGAWAFSGGTALARVAMRFSELEDARGKVWQDTWFALQQYWPAGFGMGGFEPAMLPAERLEYLDPLVPNRAHNDFLEIGLEAGLLGYLMVVVVGLLCLLMAWRAWHDVPGMRRQVIFAGGVLLLVALHSVVDYPLRSLAIASLAGVAAGMLVRKRVATDRPRQIVSEEMTRGLA